ncbi:protein SERAC1 [Schistocerca americana]|uniref:protein SERAC1 n=1 Tax=Schistocerca americana TaxID=7009 RepID=UPI001F4F98CC|nr:protein SERAC1 [Schistocerca americana]
MAGEARAADADGDECATPCTREQQAANIRLHKTICTVLSLHAYRFLRVQVVTSCISVAAQVLLPHLLAACRALHNLIVSILKHQLFSLPALSVKCAADRRKRSEENNIMKTGNEDIHIEVLYEPTANSVPRADIIFIHGLHGGPNKTWRQGSWKHERAYIQPQPLKKEDHENEKQWRSDDSKHEDLADMKKTYSACWPRDWLPLDCPGVRVIAVNYSTDAMLWCPVGVKQPPRTSMIERSCKMIELLCRIGVGNYPIVWVGHSKGGLFVKQIIVYAQESGKENLAGLYRNTRGIMFYSVPHRGSVPAKINLPFLRQSIELTEVHANCHNVLELHEKFLSLVNRNLLQAEVCSFTETVQTFMKLVYLQIVSVESADAGIGELYGAPLDHTSICKPVDRHCFLYKQLINLINRTV